MASSIFFFAMTGPDADHNKRLLCTFASVPHEAGDVEAEAVDRYLASLDWFEGPNGEPTAMDRGMCFTKKYEEFIEVEK